MMRVAIYNAETGAIKYVIKGDRRSIAANTSALSQGLAFIRVPDGLCVKGCAVKGGAFIAAPACPNKAAKKLRMERNSLLERECDPILNNVLRRRSLGPRRVRAWREYRQALLDITKGDHLSPKWPTKPE